MELQRAELAEQVHGEGIAVAPVPGPPHPREQVEQRVEPRTLAPAREVALPDRQVSAAAPELIDQPVQGVRTIGVPIDRLRALYGGEIPVDDGLYRAREAAP